MPVRHREHRRADKPWTWRAGAAVALLAAMGQAAMGFAASSGQAAVTMKMTPPAIEMGAFYDGSPIRIEGEAAPGSSVFVIIRGPAKDEVFNRKNRVGPIWINTDKVHVTGAPSLFLRFSSADVHSLLDRKTIDRYQLDELSIVERMHVRTSRGEPDAEYRELIENSYIELKKKDGTYRRVAGRVQMSESGGAAHYSLAFHWPKTAPPGLYNVEVYACKEGAIAGETSSALRLAQVGFPAFMARLAHTHPWEYGILAVIAAVIAGFGIDAIASRLLKPRKGAPPAVSKAPPPPAPAEAPEAAPQGKAGHVVHH